MSDNTVPQQTAADPYYGGPSLDADPISEEDHAAVDALLDEVQSQSPEIPDVPVETPAPALEEIVDPTPEPEPTPEETTQPDPVEEVPATTEEPVQLEIDPEIAAIEQPRNLSEKNAGNWRKLQETATTYKKEVEQLRVKATELEAKATAQQVPPDYEELKQFRAIFDTENDPEFKSKFDDKIEAATNASFEILRKNGANDAFIDSIKKAGGFDKVNGQWLKNNVIDKLDLADGERFKKNLIDSIELKEQRAKDIAQNAEKRPQFLAERETRQREQFQSTIKEIEAYTEELTKDIPWANFQEVQADATPEKKAQVEAHNAKVQDLAKRYNAALWPQDAKSRANVAASAVSAFMLTEQVKLEQQERARLTSEIKRLTDENNKIKSAGRAPRQSPQSTQTSTKVSAADRLNMSADDAIELGLSEASGQS